MTTSLDGIPKFGTLEHFGILSKTQSNFKNEVMSQSHPLYALITTFRLLGHIPVTNPKPGEFSFKIRSWWTLYCVLSTVIQVGLGANAVNNNFLQKKEWSNFDKAMNALMNLSVLIVVLHPILFTWRKSPNIVEALNLWKHLQDGFQLLTRNLVSSLLLECSFYGIMLVLFETIFIEIMPVALHFTFSGEVNVDLPIVTVYFLTIWYTKLILWLWLTFTHSTSQAAKVLNKSLSQTMATNPSVWRLRQHRCLWLQLDNYTRKMTTAIGNTVRAWMFISVLTFYLSLYATAMNLISSNTVKSSTVMPMVSCGLSVFLMNNASYLAENQIGHDFSVKILSFNYHQFSEGQLEEIELFLYAIENSSERFTLEGMIDSSRHTILDILELTITIMVVLLQFRISA